MKAAVAALAPVMSAAGLSVAVGLAYITDCRVNKGGTFDSCWLTGAGFMGIGGGAAAGSAAGFRAGFNTYNPSLRRPGASTDGADRWSTGPDLP
jgi:hypothetical protein